MVLVAAVAAVVAGAVASLMGIVVAPGRGARTHASVCETSMRARIAVEIVVGISLGHLLHTVERSCYTAAAALH